MEKIKLIIRFVRDALKQMARKFNVFIKLLYNIDFSFKVFVKIMANRISTLMSRYV